MASRRRSTARRCKGRSAFPKAGSSRKPSERSIPKVSSSATHSADSSASFSAMPHSMSSSSAMRFIERVSTSGSALFHSLAAGTIL